MTVFVLIREDQNDYGYIDTSVVGVYQHQHLAREREVLERQEAQVQGLDVEDEHSDGEWQVSWLVEEHAVS